jgi:hypothetical protein
MHWASESMPTTLRPRIRSKDVIDRQSLRGL